MRHEYFVESKNHLLIDEVYCKIQVFSSGNLMGFTALGVYELNSVGKPHNFSRSCVKLEEKYSN